MPQAKSYIYTEGKHIQRVIRSLTYLLLVTILAQEGRLGLHGIQYPALSSDAGPTGLPFLCEVIIIAIVGVFCFGIISGEIRILSSWYLNWSVGSVYWNSIAILLSYILNIEQTAGGFGAFRMIFEGLSLFVVVSNLTWSSKSLRITEVLFVIVGAFHSLVIGLSYFRPGILPFATNIIEGQPFRYAGLFVQPSRVSLLIGIAFIIAFVRLASDWVKLTNVFFYVITLSLLFVGLVLSQTRSIELAIPLAVVFALSQITKPGGRTQVLTRLLIIVGGLGLLVAIAIPTQLGFSRLSDISANVLQNQRGYIWEIAIQIIMTHPFGTGFAGLLPLTGFLEIPHAHNMYLHWGVMFGWPGLVLFCLLIVRVYKDSGLRLVKSLMSEGQTVSFMALRSAWVVCLLAFISEPYLITNTGYWFWLLAGLLIAPLANPESDGPIR